MARYFILAGQYILDLFIDFLLCAVFTNFFTDGQSVFITGLHVTEVPSIKAESDFHVSQMTDT